MRSPFYATILCVVVASACAGQIKGPTEVTVAVGKLTSVPLTVEGEEAEYTILGGDYFGGFREYSDPKTFKFQVLGYAPGSGYIVIAAVKDGKLQPLYTVVVKVTGVAPVPPPGPTPIPPPDPGPTPSPAPIPYDGFRVLVVYETGTLADLPMKQASIITAKSVREYLDKKCPAGPDGKTKEYRFFDKDIPLAGESKLWQDVMKRPQNKIPWMVISTGKTGYEGPLPYTVEDTLKLLKQFGGE